LRRAVFRGRADFTGKPIDQWMVDVGERMIGGTTDNNFRETLKQRALWQEYTTSPDQFAEISFADARFCRDVDFSGRSFTRFADFTGARFYRPRVDRIDFTGAYIGFSSPHRLLQWNSDSLIPIRFRALRKVAEDTKNHDLERDLYIEERKAERGVYLVQRFREWIREPNKKWALLSHILWIVVMVTYSVLADYGRSFVRPAAWLIASMFFFYWRYTEVLAPLMAKTSDVDKYKHAVRMLALGNTVPFVGPLTIDSEIRKVLFCQSDNCVIPPECYQMLVVGQNVFSIILVFFIGLALRNYFKIK
jgi:hypothetical protein